MKADTLGVGFLEGLRCRKLARSGLENPSLTCLQSHKKTRAKQRLAFLPPHNIFTGLYRSPEDPAWLVCTQVKQRWLTWPSLWHTGKTEVSTQLAEEHSWAGALTRSSLGKRERTVAWTCCPRSQRHHPAQYDSPLGTANGPSPLLLSIHPYWKQRLFIATALIHKFVFSEEKKAEGKLTVFLCPAFGFISDPSTEKCCPSRDSLVNPIKALPADPMLFSVPDADCCFFLCLGLFPATWPERMIKAEWPLLFYLKYFLQSPPWVLSQVRTKGNQNNICCWHT